MDKLCTSLNGNYYKDEIYIMNIIIKMQDIPRKNNKDSYNYSKVNELPVQTNIYNRALNAMRNYCYLFLCY